MISMHNTARDHQTSIIRCRLYDQDPHSMTARLQAELDARGKQQGYSMDRQELFIELQQERDGLVGGLAGYSLWGWLRITLVWVRDDLQKRGLGTQLMHRAEDEARKRRCQGLFLDTFSFQAPKFYELRGYRTLGSFAWSQTHQRIFMFKTLDWHAGH